MKLFFHPSILQGNYVLSEEESKHATRVLRMKEGDDFQIIDGEGGLDECKVALAHQKRMQFVIADAKKNFNKLPYKLHIAIAPTKNIDRFEWFLEKATEIGISEITPIICDQSERKVIKHDRSERVIISAMKQSYKAFKPTLNPQVSLLEFLYSVKAENKIIAHCEEQNQKHIQEVYLKGQEVLILIGPEGDFSPKEIEKALEKGFNPVTFGQSRLRTETAGVFSASVINLLNS